MQVTLVAFLHRVWGDWLCGRCAATKFPKNNADLIFSGWDDVDLKDVPNKALCCECKKTPQ